MTETHLIKETGNKGKGLYSTKKYGKGNIVLILKGNYFSEPTRTSIQIGDKHLESWEGGHVNHHCLPNTKVVVEQGEFNLMHYLVAIKDIEIGQQITFDYETTEKKLSNPFRCKCHGKLIEGWNVFPRVFTKVKDSDSYAIEQMMDEGGMDYSGAFESDIEE